MLASLSFSVICYFLFDGASCLNRWTVVQVVVRFGKDTCC
jgi:hypothetical protein